MNPRTFRALTLAATLSAAGCGGEPTEPAAQGGESSEASQGQDTPVMKPSPPVPTTWTEVMLHDVIRKGNIGYSGNGQFQLSQYKQPEMVNLANCGVTNIEPLKDLPLKLLDLQGCPITDISEAGGMPLVELYLDNTGVEDLSPLKDSTTLQKLYLNGTNVKDLSPLRGLPIQELNLVDTRVSDISDLESLPLRMLWLTNLPVTDVMPLRNCPLESLTLHATRIEDLAPLANHRFLMRLHIADAPVKDLTPLAGLPLTRLIFTPRNVEKGIEEVRKIPSMREIGTSYDDQLDTRMAPPEFWSKYDAGAFE